MKRSARPLISPRLAFWVLLGTLFGSLAYSRTVRHITLGDEFQYIPRENVLLVATGDVESLWTALDEHLGGFLGSSLKELQDDSEDPILQPEDLARYGLDVKRGVLLSLFRVKDEDRGLAVIPVADPVALLASFGELCEEAPERQPIPDARNQGKHPVYFCDDWWLALPQPGIGVVSNSAELMQRSLSFRRENLAHATNNDKLYEAVQRTARGPLLVGPTVFAYWQSRTAPFAERSAVLRLDRDQIRIQADASLSTGPVRIAEDLLRRDRVEDDWARQLPVDTLGFVLLQDRNLASYKAFVVDELLPHLRSEGFFEAVKPAKNSELSRYGDFVTDRLFPQLFGVPGSSRLLLAVTDIDDGLPDLLVGVRGERAGLERAVRNLQRELRRSRDMGLLSQARAEYLKRTGSAPTLAELQAMQLLEPEPHPLFDRYPLLPQGIGTPEFQGRDFANGSYQRQIDGHLIYFLTPPVTGNDFRYRQDLADADRQALAGDRHRVAALLSGETLWIATDVDDLRGVIARAAGRGQSLRENPAFERASASWERGAKLQVFFDIDRILARSRLRPGSSLESMVSAIPSGFPAYSTFALSGAPTSDERSFALDASLRRAVPE